MVSPESIFICPDCGGSYKTVKQDTTQRHFGKIITIKNVPMQVCNGKPGKPACGRKPEQLNGLVSKRVFELAKETAQFSEDTTVYYNERFSD